MITNVKLSAMTAGEQVFTPRQVERYARHIVMPTIGGSGQRALANAKVLVVGAGGLGSPASLYLALAGVGTLGIVDGDRVSLDNLQRQILYSEKDIGQSKTTAALGALGRRNSDIRLTAHNQMLGKANAERIVSGYDIVVNGADNFATRYLVNDVCYLLNKPLVDGAALRFEGRTTTYLRGQGCYRCLFPSSPPADQAPNCAEAGVLGAVVGIVGSMQAVETVKLIVGIGRNLSGRLIILDAQTMDFSAVSYTRNPNCVLCGDQPSITRLDDYTSLCGANG